MKHRIAFLVIVALAVGGIAFLELRPAETTANPRAILYKVAETEREVTRGPERLAHISDNDEIAIGNEMAQRVQVGTLTDDDKRVEAYVRQIGAQVATKARRRLPYRFHYIPDAYFVNAFALPGGHVFIGKGLIQLMKTQDELAAVLGHEVEHIDQYHCAERVEVEVQARHLHLEVLGELAEIPISVFQAGYSKQQELDADREGNHLAVMVGYSPAGAKRLYEQFGKLEAKYAHTRPNNPVDEASDIALGSLQGYFQSHPSAHERLLQLEAEAEDQHWNMQQATRPLPDEVSAAVGKSVLEAG